MYAKYWVADFKSCDFLIALWSYHACRGTQCIKTHSCYRLESSYVWETDNYLVSEALEFRRCSAFVNLVSLLPALFLNRTIECVVKVGIRCYVAVDLIAPRALPCFLCQSCCASLAWSLGCLNHVNCCLFIFSSFVYVLRTDLDHNMLFELA